MKPYLKGHIIQYIFILIIFALVVTAMNVQIAFLYKVGIIGLSIFVYFFWSIWHHWEDHELTATVILEYLLLTAILLWVLLNLAA